MPWNPITPAHGRWYGLSYAIGFLFLYRHLQRARFRLGLTGAEACALSLFIAVGVLVGGRAGRAVSGCGRDPASGRAL